ncbi:hypothetical protein ACF1DV_25855 [Streptomyces achromogenes]|uniref:hypothetical protein n=1 Tax=Streptomyces achromogenes TaxID=67255 RepID=UPI0036FD89CD
MVSTPDHKDEQPSKAEEIVYTGGRAFGWTLGFLSAVSLESLFSWVVLHGLHDAVSDGVPTSYSVAFLITLALEALRNAVISARAK